jgi:hypothetical protein
MFCFFEVPFFRIILESDPITITQRVQLRQDDIPIGEQTVSQVSTNLFCSIIMIALGIQSC